MLCHISYAKLCGDRIIAVTGFGSVRKRRNFQWISAVLEKSLLPRTDFSKDYRTQIKFDKKSHHVITVIQLLAISRPLQIFQHVTHVFYLLLWVSSDCSANHRPGYWSNLPCDCLCTARAYSEQEKKGTGSVKSCARFCNKHFISNCNKAQCIIIIRDCIWTRGAKHLGWRSLLQGNSRSNLMFKIQISVYPGLSTRGLGY